VDKPNNATLFPREVIIKSKQFNSYHPDVLRALLTKGHYTKKEAADIVNRYFSKGGK
jgi:hypothetical protein